MLTSLCEDPTSTGAIHRPAKTLARVGGGEVLAYRISAAVGGQGVE